MRAGFLKTNGASIAGTPRAVSFGFDPGVVTSWSPSHRGFLSYHLLGNRFGLHELEQIIRSASLRIGTRHVEPAERMRAYHRARALAIDVQIAHEKAPLGFLDLLSIVGVHRSG